MEMTRKEMMRVTLKNRTGKANQKVTLQKIHRMKMMMKVKAAKSTKVIQKRRASQKRKANQKRMN